MARWRGGMSQLSGLCFGEELFEASYLEGGSVARVSGQHKKPTSRIKDTRRFWRGGVGVHARHVARGPLALQSRRGRGFSGPSSSVHLTQQTEQFESSLPRALHALGGQWWVPYGEKANFQRNTGVFGRRHKNRKASQLSLTLWQPAAGHSHLPLCTPIGQINNRHKKNQGEALQGPQNEGWSISKPFLRLYNKAPQPC